MTRIGIVSDTHGLLRPEAIKHLAGTDHIIHAGDIGAPALDRADREEGDVAEAKSIRLTEKIAGLRRQMQALKAMAQTVQDAPDQQVSLTDPDARSMATSGRGTGVVGYNVQTAV